MHEGSIDYQIYPYHEALVVSVYGDITFAHMKNYLSKVIQEPDFQHGMHTLCDLSHCNRIDGDLETLSSFVASLNDDRLTPVESRTALVIRKDNSVLENLVKGIILMTSESKIEHALFHVEDRFLAYHFLAFDQEFVAQLETTRKS